MNRFGEIEAEAPAVTLESACYVPLDEDRIMVLGTIGGHEYSICDLTYEDHAEADPDDVWNFVLEAIGELGYEMADE